MTVNREIVRDEGWSNRRLLVETFWSLEEFYQLAVENAESGTIIKATTHKRVREGNTENLPRALEIAEAAVEASVEVKEMAAYVPELDVAGDYVDMGRYLAGEPECMVSNPQRTTVKAGRVITLVSSADGNSGMNWVTRGIMATALALSLAKLGYETEMWADNYGVSAVNQYQRILIKSTADEVDPARIMFGFGDSQMLGGLAFGNFDGYRKLGPEYQAFYRSYGSGSARGRATRRTEFLQRMYPEGTVFLTGSLNSDSTPLDHAQMVEMELRKLGILPTAPEVP